MDHSRMLGVVALTLAALVTPAGAQIEVRLANDNGRERATRERLLELVDEHDVSAWLYTDVVLVDQDETPHSHPVLTIDAEDPIDDDMLLSTFVHEQFHWLEDGETLGAFRQAMGDFARLFPDAPARAGGGARDQESTYRHLIVCDLELQAMTRLIGEEAARALLARITHYEWIYERVLTDPRVREVTERHGFVLDRLPTAR
jgi:hypothetical protein